MARVAQGDVLPAGHREISARLVRARANARALSGPPEGLPDSLDEAYLLQAQSIADWDDDVVGWKVGGVPAAYLDRFDEKYLAGPIFARSVRTVEQGGCADMPVFDGGFAAIEPEYVFRLGHTDEEDRLYIGAEIASSPIPKINDYGPTAVISDFGNNNGLLIGPEIADWRTIDGAAKVTTHIDGECIAMKTLPDFRENAVASLAFLRRLSAERGFPLSEGTFVSSGAITGVHEAAPGAQALLDFGAFGSVELKLVKAEAT